MPRFVGETAAADYDGRVSVEPAPVIPTTSPLVGAPDRAQREAVLAEYLAAHRRIATRFGVAEDPDGLAALAAWYTPPADARGAVLLDDALFLWDMVRCVRPRTMVELGTASGVSTAVLLRAMADAHADAPWRVETFDLLSHVYWDARVPVGYAAARMAPSLADRVAIHAGRVAADIGREFGPRGARRGALLSLVFIDACHKHPYPVADLLGVLPALAPGAWVILHDINLPARAADYAARTGESVHWGERGAQRLYDAWPHEKIAGGGAVPNIGAVRLPERVPGERFDAACLRGLIGEPWECEPDAATLARLEAVLHPPLRARVVAAARRALGRA